MAVLASAGYGISRAVEDLQVPPAGCTFATTGGPPYGLDPTQTQNAAIVAATAHRLGLPDHAVTVALAAALQESKLRDLTYGDRDSLGIFQQRPSEGWGSPSEVLSPIYASTAFFTHLAKVPGWQGIPVAQAAQAVQQSADGNSYARWAVEARALAVDLTGEAPAGVACRLVSFSGPAPAPAALEDEGVAELGVDPLRADPGLDGWRFAVWVVAHAYNYHVASVAYDGRRWTAGSGRWEPDPSVGTGRVVVTG